MILYIQKKKKSELQTRVYCRLKEIDYPVFFPTDHMGVRQKSLEGEK